MSRFEIDEAIYCQQNVKNKTLKCRHIDTLFNS